MGPDELAATVRTYFIDDDEATTIAEQAKALRRDRRRLRVVADGEQPGPDHLAAIAAAMRGEARVRTPILLGRLAEADPGTYEPWGFQHLTAALDEEHIKVGRHGGQSVVRLKDVQEALSGRPTGT